LEELNLGKNKSSCLTLYLPAICFSPSLSNSFLFLTLTRLVVVLKFINFRFALFTPPLGDFQVASCRICGEQVAEAGFGRDRVYLEAKLYDGDWSPFSGMPRRSPSSESIESTWKHFRVKSWPSPLELQPSELLESISTHA
jgi:hypothetical protein